MSQGYLIRNGNSSERTLPALSRGVTLAAEEWVILAVSAAVAMTLADAVLMERRFGVFAGGFLTEGHLATLGQRIGFLLISVLADFVAISVPLAMALSIARRAGLSAVASRFLALLCGIVPLAASDLFSYQLFAYVGDAFDLSLMFDLVGRRPAELLAVGFEHLLRPAWLALAGAAVAAAAVWIRPSPVPRPGEGGPRQMGARARRADRDRRAGIRDGDGGA